MCVCREGEPALNQLSPEEARQVLTVALPKGRLFAPSVAFLSTIGAGSCALDYLDRELSVVDLQAGFRYLLVRPSDVVTYVAEGAADVGIVGKDVLLEQEGAVYELVDLGFGECHLAVAAPADAVDGYCDADDFYRTRGESLRVATKYPQFASQYFATRGMRVRVIALRGSVELAPLVGLADVIVDLVSTGETLRANGLVEVEHVADIAARLVVNPVSLKVRPEVEDLLGPLAR